MKNYLEIKAKYSKGELDTGSVQVQIVDISAQIDNLAKHLDSNKKDFSSKRGLIILVNKRRKFLEYIKGRDISCYRSIIEDLGLRK